MTDENYTDIFAQLAEVANKFVAIAEKVEQNMGAIVSQLDEIRKEVSTVAAATSSVADDGLTVRKGNIA